MQQSLIQCTPRVATIPQVRGPRARLNSSMAPKSALGEPVGCGRVSSISGSAPNVGIAGSHGDAARWRAWSLISNPSSLGSGIRLSRSGRRQ